MNQRIEGERAYVLHTRPYRETSLLIEAMTAQHGRVSLVAKGARRANSAWRGLLQPFVPLSIAYSGRSELKTLTQCELEGDWLHRSSEQLPSLLYLNELLVKLLHPHHVMPELFELYAETLVMLVQAADLKPILRRFEKYLLSYLGYDLILDRDASQAPIEPGAYYSYHLEAGAVKYEGDALLTRHVYSGEMLLALAHDQFTHPDHSHAMRQYLGFLLSHLYNGELESRQLIYPGAG